MRSSYARCSWFAEEAVPQSIMVCPTARSIPSPQNSPSKAGAATGPRHVSLLHHQEK
jgi:hypothetical protein